MPGPTPFETDQRTYAPGAAVQTPSPTDRGNITVSIKAGQAHHTHAAGPGFHVAAYYIRVASPPCGRHTELPVPSTSRTGSRSAIAEPQEPSLTGVLKTVAFPAKRHPCAPTTGLPVAGKGRPPACSDEVPITKRKGKGPPKGPLPDLSGGWVSPPLLDAGVTCGS